MILLATPQQCSINYDTDDLVLLTKKYIIFRRNVLSVFLIRGRKILQKLEDLLVAIVYDVRETNMKFNPTKTWYFVVTADNLQ